MSPYYTANTAFVVLSMMIMMAAVGFNTTLDASCKRATRLLFLVISVAAVCEWTGNALQGADVRLIGLHKLVKFIELSCAPFIGLICGRSLSRKVQLHVPLTCIFAFHALLELRSVFTGAIWTVDAQNVYYHGTGVILYVDVDDFKQVNDTHSHTVGDQCLCTLANGLRAVYGRSGRTGPCTRSSTTTSRTGPSGEV